MDSILLERLLLVLLQRLHFKGLFNACGRQYKQAIKTQLRVTTQVKCQVGYRRDPGNPTQDPRWEWRDPALGDGIPTFPPGMKIWSHLGSRI